MQCQVPGDISTSPLSKALSLVYEVDPDSPEFDSSIIELLIHYGAVLSLEEAEFIRNELKIDILGVPFAPMAAPVARDGGMELENG